MSNKLICTNCGWIGEEDELLEIMTYYESFYGIASISCSRTPLRLEVCPCCEHEGYLRPYKKEVEE